MGRRHQLPMINIFDKNAHLNDAVPEQYRGLERFAAQTNCCRFRCAGFVGKKNPIN